MGINFVIGCHRCREYVWMLRGDESQTLHAFWRKHWDHRQEIALSCDQSDLGDRMYDEYRNVEAELLANQTTAP